MSEDETKITIDEDDLKRAVAFIMISCQEEGIAELTAYMAMITITNEMEEKLGFGYKRRVDT